MVHYTHALSGERYRRKQMFVKEGFRDECIAYALAAGMVIPDDQDGDKLRRRQRFERRKARRGVS